jgi:hypothetical protein
VPYLQGRIWNRLCPVPYFHQIDKTAMQIGTDKKRRGNKKKILQKRRDHKRMNSTAFENIKPLHFLGKSSSSAT